MHIPTDLTRRRLLRALAVAPSALITPTWAQTAAAAAAAGLIAPSVCLLAPELTEGPFYLDPALVRADITEGKPGAPVELALQVVTADCAPIAGARVDLWHCDAHGAYSGVRGPQSGEAAGTEGETFLRGTQVADADGVVRFRTIYPG